ncbi:hypothetical protein GGS23DRAFT_600022 [Durotheca rogersii]|uniref:uncharacterized protein n=1 Tax=Durotheca rogersii TaxID=419775 RepID=UPI00222003FD|nr:uncharacterized protein GGS23DRAFT_600022 [Durotheca rogersii]KAI5859836.1 hypothetical protein GGS23DRAFT_600022 [Durotheca rogersii]
MPPICKFWQQGNCRNGASCRFEHPGANTNPFGAPNSNANRFSALSTGGNRLQDAPNPYKITPESIKVDLIDERPSWILSSYGPGRDAPEQLFGGYPREQSLEEVMVHIRGSSNQQQAMSDVTALCQQAEQQIQTTLNNLDGAVQFILAAENNHPNRIDICKQSAGDGGTTGVFLRDAAGPLAGFSNPLTANTNTGQNPFSLRPQENPFSSSGGGGSSGTSAFGQPSALGQRPNPFSSTSTSTTFGQPSTMGASAPTFGQPSRMGAGGPAFGQPSALGQKPSPFSAASSGSAGFSQTAQPVTAFGQPSTVGQRPNPFGAPSSAPGPFSQTSAPNAFGQPAPSNPFAQAPATTNTPVDQPMETSISSPAARNPFGQPSSSSPFSAPGNNPFGAQPQQPSSAFGATANTPFAQGQTQPSSTTTGGGNNPYAPNSTKKHPSVESYINRASSGQITSFNGLPVVYRWKVNDKYQAAAPQDHASGEPPVPGVRNADGSWRKIFFPNGPPGYTKDTEPDPATYDSNTQAAYATMVATGRFEGDMPEVPPMREDCVWNF